MTYINTTTREYPVTEADIRRAFPTTLFPAVFAPPAGYAPVVETQPPAGALTEVVIEAAPALIGNAWTQQWTTRAATPAEAAQKKADLIAQYDAALTGHLDAKARERRYDNRITCAVRAGFDGPFRVEATAFAQWMDQCNAAAYQILVDVDAGTRPPPATTQAFLAELPTFTWPS